MNIYVEKSPLKDTRAGRGTRGEGMHGEEQWKERRVRKGGMDRERRGVRKGLGTWSK